MTTAYPGAIDNFTNPTATDTLNSLTVPHAAQHANVNDAIEAVEGTLGVDPQGGFATVVARLDDTDTTVGTLTTDVGTLQTDVGTLQTDVGTLQTDVSGLITDLGTPTGSALALNIAQVTADATDEVAAVDVNDSAPAKWFKFTIDGTEYAVPAYAIILPQ